MNKGYKYKLYPTKEQKILLKMFFNIFKYKFVQSGIVFDEIDPKDTTKTCSSCGNIQEIDLTIREYICPVCNMVKDRDWNSCINIQNKSKVRN